MSKIEYPSQTIDIDAYVRRRVTVTNTAGGRGYEDGLRVFDCPICRETRQRGWLHVAGFAAGCFNAGCDANERLEGGAIEWVRRAEGLRSRSDAWHFLHREYPMLGTPRRVVVEAPEPVEDFCYLPEMDNVFDPWTDSGGVIEREALAFMRRQWGISLSDARTWGLGRCTRGRYAWRIIIPITVGERLVSFQARTFRGAEPKYLFARHLPIGNLPAECGRPAAACLFNIDSVREGSDVLLVEGAGDVMALWSRETRGDNVPVGILGQALTPEKLAMLALKHPRRVVVGLDQGVAEERRARDHAADLLAWGMNARIGTWAGAKDAGFGAESMVDNEAMTLPRLVLSKMNYRKETV